MKKKSTTKKSNLAQDIEKVSEEIDHLINKSTKNVKHSTNVENIEKLKELTKSLAE